MIALLLAFQMGGADSVYASAALRQLVAAVAEANREPPAALTAYATRLDAAAVLGARIPPQQLLELGKNEGLPGYAYKEFGGDRAALARGAVSYARPVIRAGARDHRPIPLPTSARLHRPLQMLASRVVVLHRAAALALAVAASGASRRLPAQQPAQHARAASGTLGAAERRDTSTRGDSALRRRPRTVLTRADAVVGAAFIAASLATAPFDRPLAVGAQSAEIQSNRALGRASDVFRPLGDPGALLIGSAVYAFGRVAHRARAADVGLHVTESVVLSGAATALIKGVAGRARPFVVADTSPHHFALGRGFRRGSDYAAFPSGHSTVAFAAAAAATAEASRLRPGSARYVGPMLYAGATGVALSRMYNDKHWATDVLAGAAVGTIAGRAVVRFQHAHPGNRLDRLLLGTTVTPWGNGAALSWSIAR